MKYDVAIIGGGPAGYTAAEKAAAGGLSTVLFEKNALGGVCLNEGCVPTKTLLYSAKVYDTIKHAPKYAVSAENPAFDFPKIIARKNKVVKKLTAGIRMKMKENGVEVVAAKPKSKVGQPMERFLSLRAKLFMKRPTCSSAPVRKPSYLPFPDCRKRNIGQVVKHCYPKSCRLRW